MNGREIRRSIKSPRLLMNGGENKGMVLQRGMVLQYKGWILEIRNWYWKIMNGKINKKLVLKNNEWKLKRKFILKNNEWKLNKKLVINKVMVLQYKEWILKYKEWMINKIMQILLMDHLKNNT